MNERIEAFIDQMSRSGLIYQAGDRELSVTGNDLKYFAELIVRECAGIVEDAVDHREPASTYVGKIKEHFGVEE